MSSLKMICILNSYTVHMYTVFNAIYLVTCLELLAVFNKKFYTKN